MRNRYKQQYTMKNNMKQINQINQKHWKDKFLKMFFTHVYLHTKNAVVCRCRWHKHLTNHGYFDYGKTQRHPVWAPCQDNNGADSWIPCVYLWLFCKIFLRLVWVNPFHTKMSCTDFWYIFGSVVKNIGFWEIVKVKFVCLFFFFCAINL